MNQKADPNHKKKMKILQLVMKGKMSVEAALEKMAHLDGEDLIPPVVDNQEPEFIDDSDVPF